MAEHVHMDWEWNARREASALDHPGNPLALEWIPTFVDKDIG
jgi:hypothetical protein